jgi:endonuclease-3
MARATTTARGDRAQRIARKLFDAYPDATIALDFRNPFELLVATVLAAQCTDERVNLTTPALFERFPDASAMARAAPEEIEKHIRSINFYRTKARSLAGLASAIVLRHGGAVPRTMEDLVELPGVGRKTANVILGNAYDTPGLVVDTHVTRVAGRLEHTAGTDAVKIESDLMPQIERHDWTRFSHVMIIHGRRICVARRPRCPECPVSAECPFPAKHPELSSSGRAAEPAPARAVAKPRAAAMAATPASRRKSAKPPAAKRGALTPKPPKKRPSKKKIVP